MSTIRTLISRMPVAAYLVLAYLLSWWFAPLSGGLLVSHGPAIAAVIVVGLTVGRGGLRELWRRMTTWRVELRWYLAAPALIVIAALGAYAANLALGAEVASTEHLRSPGDLLGMLAMVLIIGGQWEEPGWTGFALPKLQARWAGRPRGALLATLVTGVFRAGWHLPLLVYGHLPWYDLIFFSLAFQFIISWLYNRTSGSVLIVMLFHMSSNIVFGGIMPPLFEGADASRFHALFVLLTCIIALVVSLRGGSVVGPVAQQEVKAKVTG